MNRKFLKDLLGGGFILWLIGYLLGIAVFSVVSTSLIGWIIMPIGAAITFWVLFKRIKAVDFKYYLYLSVAWTLIAIIFDYFFLVKTFNPADGYYKLDVYLYYFLTFLLPLLAAYIKKKLS